jgi:hypothetical protein
MKVRSGMPATATRAVAAGGGQGSADGIELAKTLRMSILDIRSYSLRQMLLGLVLIGIVGLIVELLLLKHYDSFTQVIPIASLGLGLATTIVVARNTTRATMRAFQAMMWVFLFAGLLGLFFHFKGNIEWALERTPELGGWPLTWKALRGATPALAPGALAQLGLLGLAWSFRHPALQQNEKAKENDR